MTNYEKNATICFLIGVVLHQTGWFEHIFFKLLLIPIAIAVVVQAIRREKKLDEQHRKEQL